MEIVGKIIQVLPLQEGTAKSTGNPWKSQSYVLETQEQYPRKVCFELFGEEKIKNNQCSLDDLVTVSFDIESREYNGRWYTSIRAWKVQQGDTTSTNTNTTTTNGGSQQQNGGEQTRTDMAVNPMTNTSGNTSTFDSVANDDEGTDLPF